MRARKTRIKIETLADGTKRYTPQSRMSFVWYDFHDMDAYMSFIEVMGFVNQPVRPFNHKGRCVTLKDAQDSIDSYVKAVDEYNDKVVKGKTAKVEYVKYP